VGWVFNTHRACFLLEGLQCCSPPCSLSCTCLSLLQVRDLTYVRERQVDNVSIVALR
jgi:hypothetical protein